MSVLLTDDIQLWMYILRFGVLNKWHNQTYIQHVTCYYINNIKVLNVFYHLWPFNCRPTSHVTVSVLVTLKTPHQSEVLCDSGILTIIHYKWSWRNLEKQCISEKAAFYQHIWRVFTATCCTENWTVKYETSWRWFWKFSNLTHLYYLQI